VCVDCKHCQAGDVTRPQPDPRRKTKNLNFHRCRATQYHTWLVIALIGGTSESRSDPFDQFASSKASSVHAGDLMPARTDLTAFAASGFVCWVAVLYMYLNASSRVADEQCALLRCWRSY
jgi:hypothetical protein